MYLRVISEGNVRWFQIARIVRHPKQPLPRDLSEWKPRKYRRAAAAEVPSVECALRSLTSSRLYVIVVCRREERPGNIDKSRDF